MEKNITNCDSLEEVRQNIDKIDSKLLDLIVIRSNYMNQAALFKKTENEIVTPDRVNDILQRIKILAKEKGLNPLLTERIYRTMINAFIDQEMAATNPLYKEFLNSYY